MTEPSSRDLSSHVRISPYASSSHVARGIGHGRHSLARPSFRVTAPLLFVGISTAIFLAYANTESTSPATKAAQSAVTATTESTSQSSDPAPASSAQDTGNATTGNASNQATVNTQVTINGQPVDVPANGTVSQTTTSPDGSTNSYTVTTNTTGTASNSNTQSTNLSVTSSTTTTNSSSSNTGTHGYTIVNGKVFAY